MKTIHPSFSLSDIGLIKVAGQDAEKFLQGQLTCDIKKITPMTSLRGAHCNPQGRIISLFWIFFYENAYFLLMPKNLLATALTALKKYSVFYKASITDASNELTTVVYAEIPSNLTNVIIIPVATYFMVIGKPETFQGIETPKNNNEAWKDMLITAKIPSIYAESSGKFLPHELNLQENAISFDKGCYTGQEIIARMQYRGKLKKHMYLATFSHSTAPSINTELFYENQGEIRAGGVIIDATNDKLLCVAEDEFAKNNTLFFLDENVKIFLSFT